MRNTSCVGVLCTAFADSIWLSTVKAGVSLQGSSADSQLTVASCELWEFLYSNTANLPHITTPVSAAPVCIYVGSV